MKRPVDIENNELIKARHDDTQRAFQNLLEIIMDTAEQDWQEQAACRGSNSELFFPDRGESTKLARAICKACVVKVECEEYATERPEIISGIWGATTYRERRQIRIQNQQDKAS